MADEQFEYLMGYHCAPVLCGVKPSNLITFFKKDFPDLPEYLLRYDTVFRRFGIQTEILCSCSRYFLVLVYRPEFLEDTMKPYDSCRFLNLFGYGSDWTLSQKLRHLQRRFETEKGFPHEIGAFLGYPVEDVIGFCENRGENAKYIGYWKVYGDVETAKEQFRIYSDCRDECSSRLESGESLLSLLERKNSVSQMEMAG